MSDVDVHRTVSARTVEDIDAAGDGEPGCMMALNPSGFLMACPGCAMQLHLPVGGPGWSLVSGDPKRGEGLTLSPSIHHPVNGNGCGWHGYLRNGVFAPC